MTIKRVKFPEASVDAYERTMEAELLQETMFAPNFPDNIGNT